MSSVDSKAPEKSRHFLMLLQVGEDDDISRATAMRVTEALAKQVTTPASATEIDVWLESPGGDAHSAYKIAAALQDFSSCLRVVIPDYAKSAATLMALAADELYMARTAELGPLDAQVPHPTDKDRRISALDIAECTADLAETALGIVLRGGASVLGVTQLDRHETLTELLSFAAEFTSPMVAKLDPMMMHQAASLLRVAEEYGKLLLTRRGVLDARDAHRVLQALVRNYPSHSFVIDRDQAQSVGLQVIPAEKCEHWGYVEALYYDAMKARRSRFGLLTEPALTQAISKADSGVDGNGEGENGGESGAKGCP